MVIQVLICWVQDQFFSSIRNETIKRKLLKSFTLTEIEKIEEEKADEKLQVKLFYRKPKVLRKELQRLIEKRSKENAKKEPTTIPTKGEKIKRDYELYAWLKRYHNYNCQADGYTFKKKNGDYYCEIAHIKPFATSKNDTLENLLVLCANCHKKLDYGTKRARNKILRKVGQL